MKSRIFMYLFVFTALISLYQYKSAANYVENTQAAFQKYKEKEEKYIKLESDYKLLEAALSQCKRSEKF